MTRLPHHSLAFVAILIASFCGGTVGAAADPNVVDLYAGGTVAQSSSKITPWGGGAAVDSDQATYFVGQRSLLITTLGPYQGVAFTPSTPLVIGDVRSDKSHYLTLAITFGPAQPPTPVIVPKPKPKGGLPDQIGEISRNPLLHLSSYQVADVPQPPPGGPQQPPDNGPNGPAAAPAAPANAFPTIQYLRIVIVTGDGTSAECIRAVPPPLQGASWVTMGFPLSLFPMSDQQATHLTIKRVMISGDIATKAYLGYIRVAMDNRPIIASLQGDTELRTNQLANYQFFLDSGASNVKWEWTIDDGSPAEHGVFLSHQFATSGIFHITFTVVDIDGIKAPFSTTSKVVVQEQ